jgi:hypothetical protein
MLDLSENNRISSVTRGDETLLGEYGEYNVVCRLIKPDRWIRDKFQDPTEPVHPTILSSTWAPTETQSNIDVRNFAKLFRTFDFSNKVRMSLPLLYDEFKTWRRHQHTIDAWLRTNITMNDFGTMINRLGFVHRPTRGYSTALGNCRGGYNVFIYGSVQCSDTNTFIGRVLVDPPQAAAGSLPTPPQIPPSPPTPLILPTSLGARGLFANIVSAIRIIQLNRPDMGAGFTQTTLLDVIHQQFESAFTLDQVRNFYGDFIISDDMDELIEIYSWMIGDEHSPLD